MSTQRRASRPTKTFRYRLGHRPQADVWFGETQALFNRVAAFYFDVMEAHPGVRELSDKEALTALERLTHATTNHPHPIMPLADVAQNVPALFRRAAIHAALGSARSFRSNLKRWQAQKAKAEAKAAACGRKLHFHARPLVSPHEWNQGVLFYAGQYKEFAGQTVMLKVWTGGAWAWVKFHLSGRAMPAGWEMNSPQLVKRGKRWCLHISLTRKEFVYPAKVQEQLADPSTRICAVDLNINDALAVCTIQSADGTGVATRFIRGGRELQGRRKRALGRVAVKRGKTGVIQAGVQDNQQLFRYVRAMDNDTAHRVSRRIVEFAQEHGATIIVFEHLGHFKPEKGKYSKRGNEKRSYWLRGKIYRYTQYKAWEHGLITSRVNPRNTSRECADCHQLVARYNAGEAPIEYRPGAPLFLCPACLKRGNADRNASLNIGHRLFARYDGTHFQKPVSKESGVSLSQDAGNEDGPHSQPERHEERDGLGTARTDASGTALHPSCVPRRLRPHWSGGYATGTPSAAHAGAPKEAAAL